MSISKDLSRDEVRNIRSSMLKAAGTRLQEVDQLEDAARLNPEFADQLWGVADRVRFISEETRKVSDLLGVIVERWHAADRVGQEVPLSEHRG